MGDYSLLVWVITHVLDDADRFYIFSLFLFVVSWMAVVKFSVMGVGLLASFMNVLFIIFCYVTWSPCLHN
jgi:hypothetical protein